MFKSLTQNIISGIGIFFIFSTNPAFAKTYQLDIARKEINLTGKSVQKITVNGTIPAPTLLFEEGEDVIINGFAYNSKINYRALF